MAALQTRPMSTLASRKEQCWDQYLFLLFINDLPSVVDPGTEVRLFANDCLIYRSIETTQDQIQFQEDLDALHRWDQSWGMRFNAKICNIMTITNKEDPLTKFYQLDNTILQQVDCASYLGILIHQSLKFSEHIRAWYVLAPSTVPWYGTHT